MGPVRYWDLLSIVSLWNSGGELVISGSLQTPPGTVLDDQLLIFLFQAHWCPILSLHYSAPNCVLVVIHLFVNSHVCRLKHALITLNCLLFLLFC